MTDVVSISIAGEARGLRRAERLRGHLGLAIGAASAGVETLLPGRGSLLLDSGLPRARTGILRLSTRNMPPKLSNSPGDLGSSCSTDYILPHVLPLFEWILFAMLNRPAPWSPMV
jgi:hypothetical protein